MICSRGEQRVPPVDQRDVERPEDRGDLAVLVAGDVGVSRHQHLARVQALDLGGERGELGRQLPRLRIELRQDRPAGYGPP